MPEGVPSTADDTSNWRQYFSGLNVLLDFRLDSLIQLDIAEQGAFRLGFKFSVLKLLQCLFANLAILPYCVKLQMLEVVIVSLEWSEGN